MIKHVGRHGDKKVVLLFKTVPGEDHMCLVSYSDLLPRTYHDSIMKVLESEVGQQADEFADALSRNLLPDGRNILETLHRDRLIKKVPTNQVIVTPDAKNNVRLDELNKILAEMKQGAEAIKRLAEVDSKAGVYDTKKGSKISANETVGNALSDSNLAKNLQAQAVRMKADAQSMLAESERLLTQAAELDAATVQVAEQVQTQAKARRNAAPRRRRPVQG